MSASALAVAPAATAAAMRFVSYSCIVYTYVVDVVRMYAYIRIAIRYTLSFGPQSHVQLLSIVLHV